MRLSSLASSDLESLGHEVLVLDGSSKHDAHVGSGIIILYAPTSVDSCGEFHFFSFAIAPCVLIYLSI